LTDFKNNNANHDCSWWHNITLETHVEWSYITCTHIAGPLLVWHYDRTPSYLIFHSSPGVGLISPLTFKKEERRRENIYTRISIFYFIFIKQVIAQKLNKTKLGSTLLGGSPVESPFLSRHFLEIKAIWLAFDSLTYFTTEHLIFLRKRGKKFKHPIFWKDLGIGG
jgi:hypothetical protein